MIECAVRSDMTSPASDFLGAMGCGDWRADPAADGFPDDTQIEHHDKLLSWFDLLSEEGVPPYQRAVNDLDDGIWEFKIGAARLSYFDTDGSGAYKPKFRIDDRSASEHDDDFWWFPDFDEYIRLGYPFPKTGPYAGPTNVTECLKVREEDVEHDH